MSTILQDVRYALRTMASKPLYAAVTVLVLALAIGANTTVFSIFNGYVLRPLPYPNEDRLVIVYNTYPNMGLEVAGTSIPDYLDRREQAPSLEDIAIFTGEMRTLGGDVPEQVPVTRTSPSLFSVLGIRPMLGRTFTDDEATIGSDLVAVLSYRFWNTRFGGREDVIGDEIELDGKRLTIVGVMPASFGYPDPNVVAWVPFAFTPEQMSDSERGQEFSFSIGRLAPGATVDGLNGELDAIVSRSLERLEARRPFIEETGFTGRARPLREMVLGDVEQTLLILHGFVLAMLLIACANVANLQLARMAARRRELSVRAALGAVRWRLSRLVLVESAVLAFAGAAAGWVLAYGGLELVRALGLDGAAQGFEFTMDSTVFGFTLVVAIGTALLSALLPLIALFRDDLLKAVHEAGRLRGGGRSSYGFRNALVVVQIAVSAALLVGGGLLAKSFYQLQGAGAGFDAHGVWTARITLPPSKYADDEAIARFHERALEALAALPGVEQAGYTSTLPLTNNNYQGSYAVDGYDPPAGTAPPHAQHRSISEGYLPSLGIPVIQGRNFVAGEFQPVAIVDENLANRYWPDGNALGQRVGLPTTTNGAVSWHTIVGVVPAVKQASLTDDATKETVYWYYRQLPIGNGAYTLKTTLPPEQLGPAAAAAIRQIDPDLPLYNGMSMDARVALSLGPQRAPMVLTSIFAAGAFVLAVVGIYAVLAWAVTQRYGEIGVRIALGAGAGDVVRMILGHGVRLIAIGLGIGLLAAMVLGRGISAQIYGVSPSDPAVYSIALIGLTAAALIASWLPARRAAAIDPMEALRHE